MYVHLIISKYTWTRCVRNTWSDLNVNKCFLLVFFRFICRLFSFGCWYLQWKIEGNFPLSCRRISENFNFKFDLVNKVEYRAFMCVRIFSIIYRKVQTAVLAIQSVSMDLAAARIKSPGKRKSILHLPPSFIYWGKTDWMDRPEAWFGHVGSMLYYIGPKK